MIYKLYGKIGQIVRWIESAGRKPGRALPGHTLYHFWVSPFSYKARRAIYTMGLELPFKDILTDESAYADLMKFGGKDQVPCLRIETPDGARWMYESRDIIEYLKSKV